MTRRAANQIAPAQSARNAETLTTGDCETLWGLEERYWISGADSVHAETEAHDVMIFSYPALRPPGERTGSHAQAGAGWRTVRMSDRSARRRGDLAVLSYRVSAEKPSVAMHEAQCASTYLRDDTGWLRVSHRQTEPARHQQSGANDTPSADTFRAPGSEPESGQRTTKATTTQSPIRRGRIRFRDGATPWFTGSCNTIGPAHPPIRKEAP